MKKGKGKPILFIVLIVMLLGIVTSYFYLKQSHQTENNVNTTSEYAMKSNSLENFDLSFLKFEQNEKNIVYSPLSIKYALYMLSEGANGQTKTQIDNVIGSYKINNYSNSANMSFANALFIKDSYKNYINNDYINTIKNKFNGSVIFDSFKTTDNLNNWISKNTFNLINDIEDDISDLDYILLNALAIDMDWINLMQPVQGKILYDQNHTHYGWDYYVELKNEQYNGSKVIHNIEALYDNGNSSNYHALVFNNINNTRSVTIGAVVNKYDIVKTLGRDEIKENITKLYNEWLDQGGCDGREFDPPTEEFVEDYITKLDSNYKDISSSTDFRFLNNDEVKVFAKDLKTYNNISLEYIGIMPQKESLHNYINNLDASKINETLDNLKSITLEDFEEGVVTKISGYIPLFKYSYKFDLIEDLKNLGITDVFDQQKSDLSNLTTKKDSTISRAQHKATIEFSNDGIRAAAVNEFIGGGDTSCSFPYKYEIPVKEIDMTFDKPYMYIIRDKDTKEVWFVGTVYEPLLNPQNNYNYDK